MPRVPQARAAFHVGQAALADPSLQPYCGDLALSTVRALKLLADGNTATKALVAALMDASAGHLDTFLLTARVLSTQGFAAEARDTVAAMLSSAHSLRARTAAMLAQLQAAVADQKPMPALELARGLAAESDPGVRKATIRLLAHLEPSLAPGAPESRTFADLMQTLGVTPTATGSAITCPPPPCCSGF